MKIAKFTRLEEIGIRAYETVSDQALDGCRDYVRISEYVDVEFPPLKGDEVIQKQLDALDRTESALRDKFTDALNGIQRQRAELMALPNLESAT